MNKFFIAIITFVYLSLISCAVSERTETVATISAADIRAGGVSLESYSQISSGQPDIAVLEAVKEAGYTTVIDLRTANENRGMDEAAAVEALGMRYINLPVAGAADVTYNNASRLDEILAEVDGPVLLHCQSGNRVGALYALREKQAGASAEEAMSIGKTAGLTHLEAVVSERLQEQLQSP